MKGQHVHHAPACKRCLPSDLLQVEIKFWVEEATTLLHCPVGTVRSRIAVGRSWIANRVGEA